VKSRNVRLLSCVAALVLTACAPPAPDHVPPILLFNGTGTSPNDVTAIEAILKSRKLEYSTVNSSQLNGMSETRLRAYRLMIVPGGNYITIGRSLRSGTATNIHRAVQGGLNYLGVCAGGLLAGNAPNGLNLTEGVRFDFYALVKQGIHKAAVEITGVGRPAMEHYWEDGPQFSGWGAVVGSYPDRTPAIVEGKSGKGWVILSGIHPEAPESWRRGMIFTTPTSAAHAYAGTLIDAALNGTSLLEGARLGDEPLDEQRILPAIRGFHARVHVHPPGLHGADRRPHVVGREASGQHDRHPGRDHDASADGPVVDAPRAPHAIGGPVSRVEHDAVHARLDLSRAIDRGGVLHAHQSQDLPGKEPLSQVLELGRAEVAVELHHGGGHLGGQREHLVRVLQVRHEDGDHEGRDGERQLPRPIGLEEIGSGMEATHEEAEGMGSCGFREPSLG